MKTTIVIKDLDGFLWESIKDISMEDFIEPINPASPSEQILGPMTEFEKALFSINFDVFEEILFYLDKDADPEEEIALFCYFLLNSTKENFLRKYDKLEIDIGDILHLRTQFLASYDFLRLVTLQRFQLNLDDYQVSYRQGFLVTIQNKNIFNFNLN